MKEENKSLKRMHEENQKLRDKTILFLASGGLTLTLAVYEKISQGYFLEGLAFTWFLFALSILTKLWSYCTATSFVDSLLSISSGKTDQEKEKYDEDSMKYKIYTSILDKTSILSFTIGMFIFIYFAVTNLL